MATRRLSPDHVEDDQKYNHDSIYNQQQKTTDNQGKTFQQRTKENNDSGSLFAQHYSTSSPPFNIDDAEKHFNEITQKLKDSQYYDTAIVDENNVIKRNLYDALSSDLYLVSKNHQCHLDGDFVCHSPSLKELKRFKLRDVPYLAQMLGCNTKKFHRLCQLYRQSEGYDDHHELCRQIEKTLKTFESSQKSIVDIIRHLFQHQHVRGKSSPQKKHGKKDHTKGQSSHGEKGKFLTPLINTTMTYDVTEEPASRRYSGSHMMAPPGGLPLSSTSPDIPPSRPKGAPPPHQSNQQHTVEGVKGVEDRRKVSGMHKEEGTNNVPSPSQQQSPPHAKQVHHQQQQHTQPLQQQQRQQTSPHGESYNRKGQQRQHHSYRNQSHPRYHHQHGHYHRGYHRTSPQYVYQIPGMGYYPIHPAQQGYYAYDYPESYSQSHSHPHLHPRYHYHPQVYHLTISPPQEYDSRGRVKSEREQHTSPPPHPSPEYYSTHGRQHRPQYYHNKVGTSSDHGNRRNNDRYMKGEYPPQDDTSHGYGMIDKHTSPPPLPSQSQQHQHEQHEHQQPHQQPQSSQPSTGKRLSRKERRLLYWQNHIGSNRRKMQKAEHEDGADDGDDDGYDTNDHQGSRQTNPNLHSDQKGSRGDHRYVSKHYAMLQGLDAPDETSPMD